MKNIFVLSPHLDDAICSCGGFISEAVSTGAIVTIINLFCAEYQGPLSNIAQDLHEDWGGGTEITKIRLEEDQKATNFIGARRIIGDIRDAIYRQTRNGEWTYSTSIDIFREIKEDDYFIIDHYLNFLTPLIDRKISKIFAPLGIGKHVDHIITYEIGKTLNSTGWEVEFYEDFTYCLSPEKTADRLQEISTKESVLYCFPLKSLRNKIEGIKYYETQIPMLFGNSKIMSRKIRSHAVKLSTKKNLYAEKFWKLNF